MIRLQWEVLLINSKKALRKPHVSKDNAIFDTRVFRFEAYIHNLCSVKERMYVDMEYCHTIWYRKKCKKSRKSI